MKGQKGGDCIERMRLGPKGHQKCCSAKVFPFVQEEFIVNITSHSLRHVYVSRYSHINFIEMDIIIIALLIG